MSQAHSTNFAPSYFKLSRPKHFYVVENSATNSVTATSHRIAVGPDLLKSQHSWVIAAITQGAVSISVEENYLANVAVKEATPLVQQGPSAFGTMQRMYAVTAESSLVGAIVVATVTILLMLTLFLVAVRGVFG